MTTNELTALLEGCASVPDVCEVYRDERGYTVVIIGPSAPRACVESALDHARDESKPQPGAPA